MNIKIEIEVNSTVFSMESKPISAWREETNAPSENKDLCIQSLNELYSKMLAIVESL